MITYSFFAFVWLISLSMYMHAKSLQPCLTLCDPVDCSPPCSSVHRILWARILEGVAMPSSRGSLQRRDWTRVPCIEGGFFLNEPPGKPGYIYPITTLLVESSISYHQPSPWSSVITKLLNNASAPQIEVNVSLPLEKPLNMKTATFLPATLRLGWKPYETSLKSVLFYSSCYNGIPQTGWLINNINFFLTG